MATDQETIRLLFYIVKMRDVVLITLKYQILLSIWYVYTHLFSKTIDIFQINFICNKMRTKIIYIAIFAAAYTTTGNQ